MTPPTIHRTSTGTHYFENMRTKNWQRQTIGEIRADFRLLGFTEEETDTALTKARHENAVDDVIQLEGKPRGITHTNKGIILVPRNPHPQQGGITC